VTGLLGPLPTLVLFGGAMLALVAVVAATSSVPEME